MNKEKHPKQFIYILPNLFTASSIFAGMYSIFSAIDEKFDQAAWLILLSLIFDGLDGRVARLTNTCSRFGVEFDSLADMISFGAAPSVLVYLSVGSSYGKFGVVVSILYVIFGAIRLARFNVMTAQTEPSVFIGVPIPTAAVFISILILLEMKYGEWFSFSTMILVFTFLVSLLMVSNIRYPSFKKVNMEKMHYMRVFVGILVAAMSIFLYPIEGFALLFTIYIAYGPIRAIYTFSKRASLLKKK